MNDDVISRLRDLPPELDHPGDRLERVRRRVQRRRAATVGAVAGAAAVLVGVPFLLSSVGDGPPSSTAAAGSLACPAQYMGAAPWVPDRPDGLDGGGQLVPDATPKQVVVCAYSGDTTDPEQAGWALSGRRELTSGLDGLRELRWLPRRLPGQDAVCTRVGGRQVNYLIGLTYAGGTQWVAASAEPNACVGTSNGSFESMANIGRQVAASYEARAWSPPPPAASDPDPCWREGTGRLGQEKQMVPDAPTKVVVCEEAMTEAAPASRSWNLHAGFGGLVDKLNSISTRASSSGCHQDGSRSTIYELLFTYRDGPPVLVRVDPHCRPGVDNGSLQSVQADAVVDEIVALETKGSR